MKKCDITPKTRIFFISLAFLRRRAYNKRRKQCLRKEITMKGILLAGGYGTRLYPSTVSVVKQLLPIYDKPMIYYPLSLLMQAGIREILLITTPEALPAFQRLFRDGEDLGISLSYAVQKEPAGIAEALLIGADFIGEDSVCLALGDNLFYGEGLSARLRDAMHENEGATVFLASVENPADFGICTWDEKGNLQKIEEKPNAPRSSFAVTGLYLYNADVVRIARTICPSARGELEITDVNNEYIRRGLLKTIFLRADDRWFDMGTPDALLETAFFVKALSEKGIFVGSPEAVAWQNGWITKDRLDARLGEKKGSAYGGYILGLAGNKE